jgi:hypothetical protein
MTIRDPRVGYKTSKVQTFETNEAAKIIRTEHFDGTLDATVKVKALKLSLTQGADPSREHVAAIHELEAANKEHGLAKHSGSEEWVRFTTRRLRKANERLLEVQ